MPGQYWIRQILQIRFEKRYLAEAGQYFFRDRNNAAAFEDRGAKIATQTE